MCQSRRVQINGWIEQGVKDTVGGARGRGKEATVLRAAIREARGERTDDEVLWQQDRMHAGVRNAARLVLGLGSTIAVGLLVAAFVVGADTRSTLLVALGLLVIFGGGFVGFVWSADVGMEIRADGRLVRSGWGGIEEYDLRSYRRVTVKVPRAGGAGGGFDGA